MPGSRREAISSVIALQMLIQGAYFDSHSLSELSFSRSLVSKALRALIDSGVITRYTPRRKYLFTDEFLEGMKRGVTRGMPRRAFIHYPDFEVFDLSGIESWTAEELELYVKKLKKHWQMRARRGRLNPV